MFDELCLPSPVMTKSKVSSLDWEDSFSDVKQEEFLPKEHCSLKTLMWALLPLFFARIQNLSSLDKRQFKLFIAFLILCISEDGLQRALNSDPASLQVMRSRNFLVLTEGQNQSWHLVPELSFLHED